jgi:hypothetical protein
MDVCIPAALNVTSRAAQYSIFPVGDIHIGAAACDEEKLRQDVEKIRSNKNAVWVGMGDYCDLIAHSDARRFDPAALASWVSAADLGNIVVRQVERASKILAPIAGQCVCLLAGNHEEAIRRTHHVDAAAALGVELSRSAGRVVPVYGPAAFIRMRFDRCGGGGATLDIMAHHGWFAGRKPGGKANSLHDALAYFDCDVVLVGHGHAQVSVQDVQLSVNPAGKIVERQRVAVMTGSYLRTYSQGCRGYGESAGYAPTKLGATEILYFPKEKGIKVVS